MIQSPKTIQEENYLVQKLYKEDLTKQEREMFIQFAGMYLDQVYLNNIDMNLDELVRFYSSKSTFQLKVMYKILKDAQDYKTNESNSCKILNLNIQAINIIQKA